MDLNLEKKIVLITGGAKGIGAVITKLCAQEGAFPVALDRDAEACEFLDEDLKNKGLQGMFVQVDLSARDKVFREMPALWATVSAEYRRRRRASFKFAPYPRKRRKTRGRRGGSVLAIKGIILLNMPRVL